MPDHDGLAGCWSHIGFEAERDELVAYPFRGALAVATMLRLCTDRWDTQQFKQPLA